MTLIVWPFDLRLRHELRIYASTFRDLNLSWCSVYGWQTVQELSYEQMTGRSAVRNAERAAQLKNKFYSVGVRVHVIDLFIRLFRYWQLLSARGGGKGRSLLIYFAEGELCAKKMWIYIRSCTLPTGWVVEIPLSLCARRSMATQLCIVLICLLSAIQYCSGRCTH